MQEALQEVQQLKASEAGSPAIKLHFLQWEQKVVLFDLCSKSLFLEKKKNWDQHSYGLTVNNFFTRILANMVFTVWCSVCEQMKRYRESQTPPWGRYLLSALPSPGKESRSCSCLHQWHLKPMTKSCRPRTELELRSVIFKCVWLYLLR